MKKKKLSILDTDRDQFIQWMRSQNEPEYRTRQVLEWIYQKNIFDFFKMKTLPKSLQQLLDQYFEILSTEVSHRIDSIDGSSKYLLRLHDGQTMEAVFLPRDNHYTMCISSQIGCALGCRFCATGKQGIVRNLTAGEIVSEILELIAANNRTDKGNIVLMGMGEPLLNTGSVLKAIQILTSPEIMDWSPQRITLSTSGIVPEIKRIGNLRLGINLAISLNAGDDRTRSRLMPINRKYPLKQLMQVLAEYPLTSKQQKITFEYILIKGVNDSEDQAHKLIKLLNPKKSKINLIPFNRISDSTFQPSGEEQILEFQKILQDAGFLVRIRRSQGADIHAACGQLKADVT